MPPAARSRSDVNLLRLPETLHAVPIDRVAVVFLVIDCGVVRPLCDRCGVALSKRRVAWTRCHGWDDDDTKETHRNSDSRQHEKSPEIKRDIFPRDKTYIERMELLLRAHHQEKASPMTEQLARPLPPRSMYHFLIWLAYLGLVIFSPERQTPEALGALVKADAEKWWPIIKEFGMRYR